MAPARTRTADKPLVLVTGAAGDIGSALSAALRREYRVVGLDRVAPDHDHTGDQSDWVTIDLTDDASVTNALAEVR